MRENRQYSLVSILFLKLICLFVCLLKQSLPVVLDVLGAHSTDQAGLEFTECPCLPNAGTKGMRHHTQFKICIFEDLLLCPFSYECCDSTLHGGKIFHRIHFLLPFKLLPGCAVLEGLVMTRTGERGQRNSAELARIVCTMLLCDRP